MRRHLLFTLIALTAAAGIISPQHAEAAEIKWRYFTYFPTGDRPTQESRAFAQEILEASDGRFEIEVLSAGELPYRAPDVVRAVATHQVEMGTVAVGFAAGDIPELNVFSLPFLCTSYDGFHNALEDVAPIMEDVLDQRFDLSVVVHWTMPPQNLWLNRPVSELGDLSNLRLRTWNPQQVEMMGLLGGSAVSIDSAEVIQALERGVIDGAITSALSADDWRAYDIVRTGYMLDITMGHQVMLVNNDAVEALPDDLRELLFDLGKKWQDRYRSMSETGDIAARQSLASQGVTLVTPTEEDMEEARRLMQPMWEKWAGEHGEIAARQLTVTRERCSG